MKHFFEHANSHWVRYSDYEITEDENKVAYITPANDAVPEIYDPLKDVENMVLDAVNIGQMSIGKRPKIDVEMAVLDFVKKYGLLGIMTAIPTTAEFMNYDTVYLTRNPVIDADSMLTDKYMEYFFPFGQPDIIKSQNGVTLNIAGDVSMMALALTMSDRPVAFGAEFQKEYAERIDWIIRIMRDLSFVFITSFLYYNDFEKLSDSQKDIYRKSIAIFDGIAPTYHVELLDTPTMVWDFNSLLTVVRTMFYLLLTDKKTPLRLCKHCQEPFIASRPSAVFCSPACKNRYNVYKSRGRNKGEE